MLRHASAPECGKFSFQEGELSDDLSFMEGQVREHLLRLLDDATIAPIPRVTRRDVYPPKVCGKALAVIGMRRSGKTSLLWNDEHSSARRLLLTLDELPPRVDLGKRVSWRPAVSWFLDRDR